MESKYGGDSGKKEVKRKRKKKSTKVPTKKQNGTQIDVALIKKLEFYKQSKNLVSSISCALKTRTLDIQL